MSLRLLEFKNDKTLVNFVKDSFDVQCSIIVGDNGVGKSSVLFNIAHLFDGAYRLIAIKSSFSSMMIEDIDKYAYIKYLFDSRVVELWVGDSTIQMRVDGKSIIPDLNFMPSKVLAFAHLPTDRYPFRIINNNGRYVYLGLKQTSNMMSTNALVTKILKSIWAASVDDLRAGMIADTLDAIGLERTVKATFRVRDKALLYSHGYNDFKVELEHTLRNVTSNASDIFSSKNSYLLEKAYEFIRQAQNETLQDKRYKRAGQLSFGLLHDYTKVNLEGMEFLREYKIISNPEISFVKKHDGIESKFSDLSSGDQQILGTQLRLVAEIEAKSLILIDEPEVSLHPKRQQEYVPRLYKNVPYIDSCSVIMATHSHLLVSNLPENSSVVSAVNTVEDHKLFSAIEFDPGGLPSEQVLYSVFGIDSATSYYALKDVQRIIEISQNQRNNGTISYLELEEVLKIQDRLTKSSAFRAPLVAEAMPLIVEIIENA